MVKKYILFFCICISVLHLCKRFGIKVTDESAKDEKVLEVKVKGVVLDRASGSPVVLLFEPKSSRILPIWIGFAEARAIRMFMEGISTPRPMTHDLLRNVVEDMGGKVVNITVTDLTENTYYARITIKIKNKFLSVDSRPSDAIALALRTSSPILVSKHVLESAISIPYEPTEDILWDKIGVSTQKITEDFEKFFGTDKGLIISDVKEGSKAQEAGFRRGDVILEFNGKEIVTEEELMGLLEESEEGTFLLLREGKRTEVKMKLK